MKVTIVYASRNGVTEYCATRLAQGFSRDFEVELCNLEKQEPDLNRTDFVVLGGPVRYNKLYKPVRIWMRRNEAALDSRVAGLFLCCGFTDMFPEYVRRLFPARWVGKCLLGDFGGELKPDKLHGWDRFVVKMVREQILADQEDEAYQGTDVRVLPEIVTENIDRMARDLQIRLRKIR